MVDRRLCPKKSTRHPSVTTQEARDKITEIHRQKEALRKRSERVEKLIIEIPACADRKKREELEKDDIKWLRYMFPDLFWYDFVHQQRVMIDAIGQAIRYGGDQSIAASRGEGKSTVAKYLDLKYQLQGLVPFAVILAATGPKAEDILRSIKNALETNDRLYELYPEICHPVRCLENTVHRAHYQRVNGFRHDDGKPFSEHPTAFQWKNTEIVFPHVPGSPGGGAVIATRGLDAEIRGLNKFDVRPSLVLIDDPDTEETIYSEEQSRKLENRIDRGLAFLGEQQRSIARVMLSTIQSAISVSYKFTDVKNKPSWGGKRMRFMVKPPLRTDLWSEYVLIRQRDQEEGDRFAREAHAFYIENREIMDEGAEIANPNRYDAKKLPDGSRIEESALQRYYNEVARVGQAAVSSEYDNDPPSEAEMIESMITPVRVQRQTSNYPRGIVPPGCTFLTEGIDCSKRYLHWVVRAWRPDHEGYTTGFTIDYGVEEVLAGIQSTDAALDRALLAALHNRADYVKEHPYLDAEGKPVNSWISLIDSMWRKDAVCTFCQESQGYYPSVGHGRSSGCVTANFWDTRTSERRIAAWHYFCTVNDGGLWFVHMDTDHWKEWEHDRWSSDPGRPGALLNFGTSSGDPRRMSVDEMHHHSYAHHICAEMQVEEIIKGVKKRYWKVKSHNNHWLDASYRADVGAAMSGAWLWGAPKPGEEDTTQPEQSIQVLGPDGQPYSVNTNRE